MQDLKYLFFTDNSALNKIMGQIRPSNNSFKAYQFPKRQVIFWAIGMMMMLMRQCFISTMKEDWNCWNGEL